MSEHGGDGDEGMSVERRSRAPRIRVRRSRARRSRVRWGSGRCRGCPGRSRRRGRSGRRRSSRQRRRRSRRWCRSGRAGCRGSRRSSTWPRCCRSAGSSPGSGSTGSPTPNRRPAPAGRRPLAAPGSPLRRACPGRGAGRPPARAATPPSGPRCSTGELTVTAAGNSTPPSGSSGRTWTPRPACIDGQDADAAPSHAVITDGGPAWPSRRPGARSPPRTTRSWPAARPAPGDRRAPASQLCRLEHALVLLAQHVEPAQLPGALDLLVAALVPSRLDAAARAGHDGRSLTLTRDHDGSGWTG